MILTVKKAWGSDSNGVIQVMLMNGHFYFITILKNLAGKVMHS